MASVGDMPNVPRNKMSFCSGHKYQRKMAFLAPEKLNIGLFFGGQKWQLSVPYQLVAVARP
jgi:hypothetical protein